MIRKILIAVLIIFVAIQFFGGDPPAVSQQNPNDLLKNSVVSSEVSTILKSACYDCHSNETVYPWYSKVAPVSWWLFDHVEEGREELNFSEWTSFEKKRRIRKLKEIAEEVEEGEMPLNSYTWTHSAARLTSDQQEAIIQWSRNFSLEIMSE